MITRIASLASAAFVLTLSACQTLPAPQTALPKAAPAAPAPAFVEAACGGCHAVEPPFLSPNRDAPSFAAVANRPGVTRATIRAWLINAHNYPEQMDFDLADRHVDEVSAYMITLRHADYVPVE